tara:strand:- start:684 stop:1304 length:621 start_codon:yes stop_codon:yes gene_type:complete
MNHGSGMDHMCTIIVIVAAVFLLCMGGLEMSQMKRRYHTQSTNACGMKAEAGKGQNSPQVASAKKSMIENKTGKKEPTPYMTIHEEWPVEEVDCKHKEMSQNSEELIKAFGTWTADDESTKKYKDASINQEKAKRSANTRPIDIKTGGRTPLSSKNLGTPGFMAAVRESSGKGTSTDVKFADSCVEFLQSDAYVQARVDNNKSCGL